MAPSNRVQIHVSCPPIVPYRIFLLNPFASPAPTPSAFVFLGEKRLCFIQVSIDPARPEVVRLEVNMAGAFKHPEVVDVKISDDGMSVVAEIKTDGTVSEEGLEDA